MGITAQLANLIYGEVASEKSDTMEMVGSSALNRLEANKPEEFGATLEEVMNKGYYAVINNTDLYQQAITGKFPDKKSEDAYKKSLQIANGLIRGTIKRRKGHFYFKPEEVKKQKKAGFDFGAVEDYGVTGQYNVFGYGDGKKSDSRGKQSSSVIDGDTFNEAFKSARESGLKEFTWSKDNKKYKVEVK